MRFGPANGCKLPLALLLAASVAIPTLGGAARGADVRPLRQSIADLRLPEPLAISGVDAAALARAPADPGRRQVIVRLTSPAVAELAKARGSERSAHRRALQAEQADFLSRAGRIAPGLRVLAATQLVLNAVFLEVDERALPAIARDPAVLRVAPVGNYELDLSDTVPYIGAAAVQAAGFDGSGIRVAVLDSGVDYTHANLGGPGTPLAFQKAYGAVPQSGKNRLTTDRFNSALLFPTAKVVGGFDFVGEAWPSGPLAPDPDPIDINGHGTHVADIIGGMGGVAPGTEIYAVRVCASFSPACSGVALIQGMEFAVDPDGDGDPADAVDIINMSLGADYGQPFDDDLSLAVENATALGVLTVASAGNGSDKPFVQGSPAATPSALSVAQTHVPSAFKPFMTVLEPADRAGDYDAVFQPWSVPQTEVIEGPVQYGDGAGGNLDGCAPFAAGSLSGIVFVDRGACNFTLKISNIGQAGGALGIIGLVAPGEPFPGGDGGDRPITIPGYMISQADADILRGGDAVVRFDPSNGVPLVLSMVGGSSRGPQYQDFRIKPEIGAPGASVSAQAGTGAGQTPFGGTSGAAPMVTGSAALLLQARPALSPLEVKALLMNNGETDLLNEIPGDLAPISRLGGGEVRVDRALAAPAAAWDADEPTGSLGFGFVEMAGLSRTLTKSLVIRNYSPDDIAYSVTAGFRFAEDAANGAISVAAPATVTVPAGSDATLSVDLTIDGTLLPGNFMNSGSNGANPSALTANEYDGYLVLAPTSGASQPIQVPWHVLPRRAARLVPERTTLDFSAGNDQIGLENTGVGTAQNDGYSLLATSPDIPEGGQGEQAPTPDLRAVGVQTIPVPANFCSEEASYLLLFAVNTWERQTHANAPGSMEWYLDVDRDGTEDWLVITRDVTLNDLSDGRNLTWAVDLEAQTASAFFFTEHAVNTANHVMIVCAEQIGKPPFGQLIDSRVVANDFYFGGPGDEVTGITFAPLGERYLALPPDVPGNSSDLMEVVDFGPDGTNPGELGVLLLTNGDRGPGNRGGATADTEAIPFTAPGP